MQAIANSRLAYYSGYRAFASHYIMPPWTTPLDECVGTSTGQSKRKGEQAYLSVWGVSILI